MRRILDKIECFYMAGKLLEHSGSPPGWEKIDPSKDFSDEYPYYGPDGRYYIVAAFQPFKKALKWEGADDISEITGWTERKWFVETYGKIVKDGVIIKLLDWHSSVPGNGLGRKAMQKILDLGVKYKTNQLHVFNPTDIAKKILNHYEDLGVIKKKNKWDDYLILKKVIRDN